MLTGTAEQKIERRRTQTRAAQAVYRQAHPERVKAASKETYKKHGLAKRLRNRYGLTVAEYDALLASQGGHCAICPARNYVPGTIQKLAVDHDHKTNEVRGLLCFACNSMLGRAEDLPERLEVAAQYLRKNTNRGESSCKEQ